MALDSDPSGMVPASGRAEFPNTRWTLVAAAGSGDSVMSCGALVSLCEIYWYPLYAYARRRGISPELAQDYTQEFFSRLLEHNYFDRADPEKGRFRSFLLAAFKYYLSDEADRSRAQKRGGGLADLPLEVSKGEEMYAREPSHDETPERIYERRWARALLDRVLSRLCDEFKRVGRQEQFDRLKDCLEGGVNIPYSELARDLRTTEAALKVGIYRMRKRYRHLLRSEVADIVNDPADVDSELRYLIAAMAGRS
jgi:RNA polymerase sigma factor (sigma-70 family)